MAKSEKTTIAVTEPTKERLRERGGKGDTYEEIIVELLEIAEETEESE